MPSEEMSSPAPQVEVTRDEDGDDWLATIALPGERLRYVFRFPYSPAEELPARPGVSAQVKVGIPECRAVSIEPPPDDDAAPLTARAVRELADHLDRLHGYAKNAVTQAALGEIGKDYLGAFEGAGASFTIRPRRVLTPEFLRDIARRHADLEARGLPPTQTLAREEGVSVGTVKYWLRKARAAAITGDDD